MERLCRACARPAPAPLVLAPRPAGFHCARALADITGQEINADDGLPMNICRPCVNELKAAWYFKRKCHRSIQKLTHIRTIKAKMATNVSKLSVVEEAFLFTECFPEFKAVVDYEATKKRLDEESHKILEVDDKRFDSNRIYEIVDEFDKNPTNDVENNANENYNSFCETDDEDLPLIKHSNQSKCMSKKLNINEFGKNPNESDALSCDIDETNKEIVDLYKGKNIFEVVQYADQKTADGEQITKINKKVKTKIVKRAKFKKKKMSREDRKILAVMESLVEENLKIVPYEIPRNVLMKKKDTRELKRQSRVGQASRDIEDSLIEVIEKLVQKESTKDVQKCKQKEATHVCSECAKVYAAESGLRAHMQQHNGYRFICEHCAKGFPSHAALRRHAASAHGAPRPFPCVVCPYRAAGRPQLRRHESMHSRSLDRED